MSNGSIESNDIEQPRPEPTADATQSTSAIIAHDSRLEIENKQLRDFALRAAAETENTRRRGEVAEQNATKYAVSSFAREILGVADSFQKALETANVQGTDQALCDGIRATGRLLASSFEKFGISKIDALGQPFDPNLHQAVMERSDFASRPGTIVQVLEDGYRIHERLLRPASVVIASGALTPARRGRGDRSV